MTTHEPRKFKDDKGIEWTVTYCRGAVFFNPDKPELGGQPALNFSNQTASLNSQLAAELTPVQFRDLTESVLKKYHEDA